MINKSKNVGNDVTTVNPEYEVYEKKIRLCMDMYDGIDTASKYIIQNPNEYLEDFTNRVERATLNSFVERTITTMVSQVFRKALSFEDVDDSVIEDLDNATERGLNEFGKDVLGSALLSGKSYVLVDMPVDGGSPYFSPYDRLQLINWRKDSEGNFTLVVLEEVYEVLEGQFGISYETQYRVVDALGNVQIWRGNGGGWSIHEEVFTSYGFCPFYEIEDSLSPALYDIARINAKHLNFSSTQDDYLLEALTPVLFGKGLGLEESDVFDGGNKPDVEKVVIGVRSAMFSDNPDADIKWLEMSGSTYSISSENLLKMEEDMGVRALKLQSDSSGSKTATQIKMENSESTGRLSDMANSIERLLNKLMEAYYAMLNKTVSGSIIVNKDFITSQTANDLGSIAALFNDGIITQETTFKALNDTEVIKIENIEKEIADTADRLLELADIEVSTSSTEEV